MKDQVVRELRAVQRYSVNLPVLLTSRAPGRPDRQVSGFTRDVSTRGMFVLSGEEPAPGEILEFEIDMALDESTPLVLVQGEGRVVRTERSEIQPAGFAVHNVWFKLREPDQGQALPANLEIFADKSLRVPVSVRKAGRHHGLAIVPPPAKVDSDQGELK